MNSDEYHTFTLDNDHNNICRFCGETFGEHEQACPHNPNTDDDGPYADGLIFEKPILNENGIVIGYRETDPVYSQLKEPWTEAP